MTEPLLVVRHSRALLIGVGALALLCAIVTFIGGVMFGGGPVEEIYRFGMIVDLVAMALTLGIVTLVEYVQRRTTRPPGAPVNGRFSIFAIIAVAMSVIAFSSWCFGGFEQFTYLLTGVRGRYMYHTGTLFLAGIPWVLGVVFGSIGFRPGANRVTNILALVAVGLGLFLAIVTTIASLVYGLGYSD